MMALSLDFSFNDLKNAIEKISFSVDNYRLLCRAKQLDISDETKFNYRYGREEIKLSV
jgi:hypothetical protein